MTSVGLFDDTAAPDGWHDVRAPGGYEWWYFDAQDAAVDTQVVVILMQGFIFHPTYVRRSERYRRKPTRTTPPLPAEYPCAYLCVYRNGAIWQQFMTQFRPDQFSAARDRAEVSIGPNSLRSGEAFELSLQGAPWLLTSRGPRTFFDRTVSARLTFRPRHRHLPIQRVFLSREMTGARHQWVIADPLCDVAGQIEVSGAASMSVPFAGQGYHDHNFGTGPIGPGLARWIWGRAIFGDRVLTFHHAEPRDRSRRAESHLIRVDAAGVADLPAAVTAEWTLRCGPAINLTYPATMKFGEHLTLSNPRVIDPAPFYMRLMFDAVSHAERSTAFCEVAYPHRLRWPLLPRLIEMSFDQRSLRAAR